MKVLSRYERVRLLAGIELEATYIEIQAQTRMHSWADKLMREAEAHAVAMAKAEEELAENRLPCTCMLCMP